MPLSFQINNNLSIPQKELGFTFSCSTGPGGQNVNKVNTRVTLWFDILSSQRLSSQQKMTLSEKFSSRINKNGVLRVISYKYRSQYANKAAVIETFCSLIRAALIKPKKRRKTMVPINQKVKRLNDKKLHSRLKKSRKNADDNL